MIDTHIHLSSIDYYNNPDQVLGLLEENGVSSIVNVATDIETSKQSIKLSQKFPKLSYATVGIHPEEINSDTDTQVLKQLEQLVQQETVVAVGEVGLDKTYIQKLGESEMIERFNWQNNWLDSQVLIAKKYNLPLILHSRDTTLEMLEKIKELKNEVRFVWHCFSENLEVANQVIDNGGYISFTGIITYKSAVEIESVIKQIPADRYMIETDGPFLIPEPLKKQGLKPNMPWYVKYVAEKIASVRGESVNTVLSQTDKNSKTFFQI